MKKRDTELKLLPPNKKFECPDCHRKLRRLEMCVDKVKRCKSCKKKLITNKFYVPPEKRREYISKFGMTKWERQRLFRKFISEGQSEIQAKKSVAARVSLLKNQRRKKAWSDKQRRRHFAKKKEADEKFKKRFMEGLR